MEELLDLISWECPVCGTPISVDEMHRLLVTGFTKVGCCSSHIRIDYNDYSLVTTSEYVDKYSEEEEPTGEE